MWDVRVVDMDSHDALEAFLRDGYEPFQGQSFIGNNGVKIWREHYVYLRKLKVAQDAKRDSE